MSDRIIGGTKKTLYVMIPALKRKTEIVFIRSGRRKGRADGRGCRQTGNRGDKV